MKETIGHATSRKLLCGPTMEQTLSHLFDDRVYSWSSLVKGDEVSYLPNCQTNLVIALHAPSLLFWHFINTTAYDLGRYMPSSPVKAHSHSPQRSADSAVDCVNAEIGIFLSLRSNATVCRRRTRKTQ